jgi:hypothetical protein
MTREEKLRVFGELTKLPNVKRASVFADELAGTARILINHPHSGRPWRIMGVTSVPGFYRLTSSVPIGLDYNSERMDYQSFTLVLHETEFTRIH